MLVDLFYVVFMLTMMDWIDLGANFPIIGATIWHYHGDTRRYCSQKVALSTTGLFQGEEVVVYDTGLDYGELETDSGNTMAFDHTIARYVRHWSGRSDQNTVSRPAQAISTTI